MKPSICAGICAVVLFSVSTGVCAPPYPRSETIETIVWDYGSHADAAPGSDLWPTTWADDNHLYTSWGDGGGFDGDNSAGRVEIGVARVEGSGHNWQGYNVWGGYNPESSQAPTSGKCNGGIVSIDGTLYLFVTEQWAWLRCKLWKSVDHGMHWTDLGWIFDEPGGAFGAPAIVQYGKDYQGARDNYVYMYSKRDRTVLDSDLLLARVPKNQIEQRNSYEFVRTLNGGVPVWTPDITLAMAVFYDARGVEWGYNISYNAGVGRYLFAMRRDSTGSWGIYDAPEPWGPWTTVVSYPELGTWSGGSSDLINFCFPTKWISADGTGLWMIYSEADSFDVIRGELRMKTDTQAPAAPNGLVVR